MIEAKNPMRTYTPALPERARFVRVTKCCGWSLALLLLVMASSQSMAFDFSSGEWSARIDSTVSYGAAWRLQDADEDNLGKAALNPAVSLLSNAQQRAAPGRWSVNSDDGNLNYQGGDLISNALKLTSEMELDYRNYGAFVRFSALYDFENEKKDQLSEEAKDKVGKDIRLLDAYIWGNHQFGDRGFTWRLGRQVVSWGESTFIQGGINVINPVDVSKIRVAGAELKEAYMGVNMLWGSVELSQSVSIEPLYIFEYQEIEPDPVGSYFSTNDLATPGATYAMLNFGLVPQPVVNPDLYNEVCLNHNYAASDSLLPAALVAGGCMATFPRVASVTPNGTGQYGAALRWYAEGLNSTEFAFYYLNYHSRLPLISGTAITSTNLNSGQYWTEYPKDIHLYGISFNTSIGTWSLAGEVSYRPNIPLQIDDVEVLFAGLTPLNALIPQPVLRFKSQLGEYAPGAYIQGWERHKMWQAQATTTKLFGPGNPFKADQIAFVLEAGFNHVDLPAKDWLRFNGDGTDTGGGPDYLSGDFRNPITQTGGFADDFSWGYRLLLRAEYNNVFGTAVTMAPSIGWAHDVSGTTPGPGGSFIEGRKTVTLGLSFNYLQQWVFDFSYTAYMGAGPYNLLKDRDFVGASVRYSF